MELQFIPIANLALAFIPVLAVIAIMSRWGVGAGKALYANARMLIQLVAIGYVLTYIFESDNPWAIVAVLAVMMSVSAWIAMRPLSARGIRLYAVFLAALGSTGLAVFLLVTQLVLDVGRWFEPSIVVPIAGMIFANSMNTVSLTAERFEAELGHGTPPIGRTARRPRRRADPADQHPICGGPGCATRHDDRPDSRRRRPLGGRAVPDRRDVHDVRRWGPRGRLLPHPPARAVRFRAVCR